MSWNTRIKEVRIGNKAIVVGLQFSTKFSSGSIISLRTDFYAPCMQKPNLSYTCLQLGSVPEYRDGWELDDVKTTPKCNDNEHNLPVVWSKSKFFHFHSLSSIIFGVILQTNQRNRQTNNQVILLQICWSKYFFIVDTS